MSRSRWFAAAVASAVAVSACSGGSDEKPSPTTLEQGSSYEATAARGPGGVTNPCALTTVDQVRAIFGGPVGASRVGGLCRYRTAFGDVRFTVARRTSATADSPPAGTPITGLGDLAIWNPADGGGPATLNVRRGKVRATFIIDVDLPPSATKGRAVAWANTVFQRLEDDPSLARDLPAAEVPATGDRCRLLGAAGARIAFARDVDGVRDQARGTCTYTAPDGRQLTVGPVVEPASGTTLDTINRTVTIGNETITWKREVRSDLGQGAVILSDPRNPGTVEMDVLSGLSLIHLSARGRTPSEARQLAVRGAQALLARL